ncbi:uncharacterized protein FFE2_07210 [Fusarium fujikuroi]|nr:uncharacterized protein FFE2_07210 [Fusarium fujikuroi]
MDQALPLQVTNSQAFSQPDEINGIPTAFYIKQARPYRMPVTKLSRYLIEEVK